MHGGCAGPRFARDAAGTQRPRTADTPRRRLAQLGAQGTRRRQTGAMPSRATVMVSRPCGLQTPASRGAGHVMPFDLTEQGLAWMARGSQHTISAYTYMMLWRPWHHWRLIGDAPRSLRVPVRAFTLACFTSEHNLRRHPSWLLIDHRPCGW